MIKSLIDGFVSGFFSGLVFSVLLVSNVFKADLPSYLTSALIVAVIFACTTFVWGVHSALVLKERE